MKLTRTHRIETWAVLLLIGLGYGLYSGWNGAAVTLAVIAGSLLIAEGLGGYFAERGQQARKQLRRMTPAELEAYLATLPKERRGRFVAHLLEAGPQDERYLSSLTPEQRQAYERLLEKLRQDREAAPA